MLPHFAPAARTGRNHRSGPHDHPRSPTLAARVRAGALIAFTSAIAACTGVPNSLGSDRATAKANAESLFDGLAQRFDKVQRTPKFHQARSKLGRYALSPSKLFRDTSVWTAVGTDSTRTLVLSGSHTATGYVFDARPGTGIPSATGDSRHVIRLRRRAESEYRWDTSVDHAIGFARPKDIAHALTLLMTSVERASPLGIRADTRTLLPRTARVLGELFTLDTVRITPQPDGTRSVLVRFTMDSRRLEKTRPNFAKYLEKYVEPARYRLRLLDAAGTSWLDASGSDKAFTIGYRVRDGAVVGGIL